MPARFGETPRSAISFLEKISLEEFSDLGHIGDILSRIDALAPENHAAKTAFDLALHDWVGKKLGQPWHKMWGLNLKKSPRSSFTIGIDTPEVVRKKVLEAEGFHILKVKLGRDNDREMIETIRSVTDRPLTLDPNEGWADRNDALKKLEWMATQGAILCEQPLPRTMIDDQLWLKERSPIPIIADESVFRLKDIRQAVGLFHGINIKLMKCTGLHEARRMIELAKGLDLKVMLGCMTETSCAIAAASQLSPLVDWVDLDGAALIANDPFTGVRLIDGRITPSDEPGLGIRKAG
jgi:L-alanine-DL-glutamate epimerase-like enolase superfamily enzyme